MLSKRSQQEINCLQLKDGPIHLLIEAIGCDTKVNIDDMRLEGPDAQCFLQLWERLCIDNSVLKRKYMMMFVVTDSGCNWLCHNRLDQKSSSSCILAC